LIAWWRSSSSTLVANPEQVLSECHRVVKPGGPIILVNHFYSEKGVAAAVERWAAKRTRALGLRPEFPFARLQAQSNQDANLVERRKVAPFGIYTLSVSSGRVRRRGEGRDPQKVATGFTRHKCEAFARGSCAKQRVSSSRCHGIPLAACAWESRYE
jgi:hypothetical protein